MSRTGEGESEAGVLVERGSEFVAEGLAKGAGERQAEAAVLGSGAGGIFTPEAVEETGQVVGREMLNGVGDGEVESSRLNLGVELELSARGRVFDGVVELIRICFFGARMYLTPGG